MIAICNRFIPFGDFAAINLFGVLFFQRGVRLTPTLMRHEMIHTRQQRELGYIGFYVLYVLEWLYRLPQRGNAYFNISFEREAYAKMGDIHYLECRPWMAWRRYWLSRS